MEKLLILGNSDLGNGKQLEFRRSLIDIECWSDDYGEATTEGKPLPPNRSPLMLQHITPSSSSRGLSHITPSSTSPRNIYNLHLVSKHVDLESLTTACLSSVKLKPGWRVQPKKPVNPRVRIGHTAPQEDGAMVNPRMGQGFNLFRTAVHHAIAHTGLVSSTRTPTSTIACNRIKIYKAPQ